MTRTVHTMIDSKVSLVWLFSSLILLTGCSSQIKITQISGEPRPRLVALQEPINATIGIIPRKHVEAGKTKRPYVSNAEEISKALGNRLRDLKAFKTVYYPLNTDVPPDTTVGVEAEFYIDPRLAEARATGFVVGLTLFATAPLAQYRATIDERSRITMTGLGKAEPREVRCSYEVKFNPFANVNARQAGMVMGQNAVQHVADVLALEVIRAHKANYRAGPVTEDHAP